jgi:predicted DNA-binding protein
VRRKSKKDPLQVTSFRLPPDVKAFLKGMSEEKDRTMSYCLVEVLRLYMNYLAEQKKQPKTK